jgi:hypothetical protein
VHALLQSCRIHEQVHRSHRHRLSLDEINSFMIRDISGMVKPKYMWSIYKSSQTVNTDDEAHRFNV